MVIIVTANSVVKLFIMILVVVRASLGFVDLGLTGLLLVGGVGIMGRGVEEAGEGDRSGKVI